LLKKCFSQENSLFIDLLNSEQFNLYASNPPVFRQAVLSRDTAITHVVIDEIQRVPELLNDIHSIMEGQNPPFFVMSGSSARKLKRSRANMLGGRAWTIQLFPLTHVELNDMFNLQKSLQWGTLPSVYLETDTAAAQRTLRSYVDTYLREEIMAEAIVRNIGAFLRFLPLAADANGMIVNYSNIGRETGVSYNTIKEFFRILEDTLLGFFLMPFSRSVRKQMTKHPKFYLFDTGVQRAMLRKAAVEIAPKTFEYGKAFEHFIVVEAVRLSSYREKEYAFSFFNTANDAEVDMIIERPDGEIFAVEIKASDNPAPKTLRGLHSFKQVCDKAHLVCACTTPHPFRHADIAIMPWKDLFRLLELA